MLSLTSGMQQGKGKGMSSSAGLDLEVAGVRWHGGSSRAAAGVR